MRLGPATIIRLKSSFWHFAFRPGTQEPLASTSPASRYTPDPSVYGAAEGVSNALGVARSEAYNLALSKLERNLGRDREDIEHLGRIVPLDADALGQRYKQELRPYLTKVERHDLNSNSILPTISCSRLFGSVLSRSCVRRTKSDVLNGSNAGKRRR